MKVDEWITKDGQLFIEGWARNGLNDKQIAKNIGISRGTLYAWIKKHAEIADALKRGRRPLVFEDENVLHKSANGFKETIRKPFKLKTIKQADGKRTEEEHIAYADEEIYIPPNITALIFELKNRAPETWRDRPAAKDAGDASDNFIEALDVMAQKDDWNDEG